MKLFKIPLSQSKVPINNKVIGIIDASGSMTKIWPMVADFWNKYIPPDNAYTITFDNYVRVCSSNILDHNIKMHGGGQTNIIKAFEFFERKMADYPPDTSLTMIFISDGQDTDLTTLEKRFNSLKGNFRGFYINFICLGIQSEFPTFLSMKLRKTYHSGDETVPAIFLIEYASEKAFLNKFESMKHYFMSLGTLKVYPAVYRYPWSEPEDLVFEKTWVLTDSSKLEVEGEIYDLSRDNIDPEGAVEIFKGWVQTLHLESLKPNANISDMATKTLKFMEMLAEQIKKEKGIDILKKDQQSSAEEPEGLTFHQRVLKNLVKHTLLRAAWFYEDVKLLVEKQTVKQLNEYDAAKRIGIGTIVGKYHQKALALKGITVDHFKALKEDFISTFKETKLNPQSSQEGSVITLQNQKEAFLQKDFIEGLKLCNSQFDLVEAFPLVGLAIKIKRFNGSMLNPWMTQVRFIAKHHKAIDTISINKDKKLELKIGDNLTEQINGVLPLFGKDDADMKPLVSSKLYHLIMNFNVMQNVDTLYEDAYLALLSNTLLYLLIEKESEWKNELLKAIENTVRMVYAGTESYETYREQLIKNPVKAISKDQEQIKYGSIDLSKAILHLFMLRADELIDDKKGKEILDAIYQYFFHLLAKKKEFDIKKFFKSKASEKNESILDRIRSHFKDCWTMGDLRRLVYKSFQDALETEAQYEYSWEFSELSKLDQKIQIYTLKELGKLILGITPVKEEYILWIGRAYLSENFEQIYSEEMQKMKVEDVSGKIGYKITFGAIKNNIKQLPACKSAVRQMASEFKEYFKKIHWQVTPISKEEFAVLCVEKNIKGHSVVYSPDTCLVKNACLARECPYFMNYNVRLHHHLDIWDDGLPLAFHKTVKRFYAMSPEDIYEKFASGAFAKEQEDKYHRTKEEVIQYICRLKEAYEKILA